MEVSMFTNAKSPFTKRLNAYLNRAGRGLLPLKEVDRSVIDEGRVAIKNSLGEIDVYFDWWIWEFVNKRVWPDDNVSPPALRKWGLGVLPGLSCSRPTDSFERAREFADELLVRI